MSLRSFNFTKTKSINLVFFKVKARKLGKFNVFGNFDHGSAIDFLLGQLWPNFLQIHAIWPRIFQFYHNKLHKIGNFLGKSRKWENFTFLGHFCKKRFSSPVIVAKFSLNLHDLTTFISSVRYQQIYKISIFQIKGGKYRKIYCFWHNDTTNIYGCFSHFRHLSKHSDKIHQVLYHCKHHIKGNQHKT